MALKVILDDTTKDRILGASEHVELCDNHGKRIGHFLTEKEYQKMLYATMKDEVTIEELDASFKEPGGIGTQELLSRLNAL